MNSEDFSQQLITAQGMIPDLCSFLDNTGSDDITFDDMDSDRRDNNPNEPKQCVFVKCGVDEKFYMPPKTFTSGVTVYGASPDFKKKVTRPRKIFVPCSGLEYRPPLINPFTSLVAT